MIVTLDKVRETFEALFDVDPHSVSLETQSSDIPGWDSVGHLSLCGALEEAFEVRFDVSDFAEMNSVRTIIAVIDARRGVAAGVSGPQNHC
jgi:acyl carrier protein